MIIPVRCFTCGKVLANKWVAYEKKIADEEKNNDKKSSEESGHHVNFDVGSKGKFLDELGIKKICCRRHMLGHVEIIDII